MVVGKSMPSEKKAKNPPFQNFLCSLMDKYVRL